MTARKILQLQCTGCAAAYTQQVRVYKTAVFKGLCPSCRRRAVWKLRVRPPAKKPVKTRACLDCGKLIWHESTKCKSCAQKKPRKSCVVCGVQLSISAKSMCRPCHNRAQDRGLSRERTKFQQTKAWREVRLACFARDNHACRVCGCGDEDLNAHHLKSWAQFPELRLDLANLITVCMPCHASIHALWVIYAKEKRNAVGGNSLCRDQAAA